MNKISFWTGACLMSFALGSCQQPPKGHPELNDSNTALHLLVPQHVIPYKEWNKEEIKASLDQILSYLETATPMRVAGSGRTTRLEHGDFRLASYEWGVTYSGMLKAAQATGDVRYIRYVTDRLSFLAREAPRFEQLMKDQGVIDKQMKQLLHPEALDDAGSMCAAFIKARRLAPEVDFSSIISNYMQFIEHKEHRLSDGTFARMRPQANTLWLDDMYMAIPAIAQMGSLTGENRYFDEAVKQIRQFSNRMFVPEKKLYMHGWVEEADTHPAFHWGRANGWALLTLTEVLDVLPAGHPDRNEVLQQYREHVKGIASCQSSEGFWHQLLDRNDSYLETSATAIFVYCIAHGINQGWLNPISYGPVAQLGWSAVASCISEKGQVKGTCVGTGMAFDPAYYYYRPVNVYAAHGYGPTILAGSEIIMMLQNFYPRMNDSAVQYYRSQQKAATPIFGVDGKEYR